jgi:hypothetical protein
MGSKGLFNITILIFIHKKSRQLNVFNLINPFNPSYQSNPLAASLEQAEDAKQLWRVQEGGDLR